MRASIASLGLLGLSGVTASPHGSVEARRDLSEAVFQSSSWYDWGWYGARPQQRYRSFDGASPKPNVVLRDDRCDEGLVFLEPRQRQLNDAPLVILDGEGNLVWTATQWAETNNVKVQTFNGSRYMTFWTRDKGTSGDGYYVMLDESYEVFKEIRPAGSLHGDVQDLVLTPEGTAILTVYHETQAPKSKPDPSPRRIYDSIFQEIDLASGKVLFEWHASHHFGIQESRARCGRRRGDPFDFFHINAVDKDSKTGDFLVSSRFMGAIASVNGMNGHVQWQLGGEHNDFEDLSKDGAITFSWDQRAAWASSRNGDAATLNVVDGKGREAIIELNLSDMTATSISNRSPPAQEGSHHGRHNSVQILPNGNALVSWAHAPGFTEFSKDGETLCDTHLGPVRLASWGLPSSLYRASKFAWAGRPRTKPSVAMRPDRHGSGGSASLYVSWNGATEVDAYILQSGPEPDGDVFVDHVIVPRDGFETRIPVPLHSEEYLRVLALDREWRFIEQSGAVSKRYGGVSKPLEDEKKQPPKRCNMLIWIVGGLAMVVAVVHRAFLVRRRRTVAVLPIRGGAPACDYKRLPSEWLAGTKPAAS
ncbi:hypothetical protein JDV02_008731 [Purpureocillium takamizusanense]|uniref:Arylsulfotransferase n=1 Tax=Purpureocillium takamizusanense TaxID=2060973 RepID=A0A9Q8QPG8_9HYPO|nr:uncharacterized protein JDV02_008731 [Purpureocillium takamizusanense]UNI22886.1 hypothetical protein JDV02_008731 [Purpureocillium takamizusanense]